MKMLPQMREALLQLFFPHYCCGCGEQLNKIAECLCFNCLANLPLTGYFFWQGNPVEAQLSGRIVFERAAAYLFYTENSLVQRLVHDMKYRGNKTLGVFLGGKMGEELLKVGYKPDMIVPLPLHRKKLRKRGYNQAALIASGIGEVLQVPVREDILYRKLNTVTQTRKGRMERWENMDGVFALYPGCCLKNENILLIDDILTTGATLEACAKPLQAIPEINLTIATLAYTAHI